MIAPNKKTNPPSSMVSLLPNLLVIFDANRDDIKAARYRDDVKSVRTSLSNLQY
ncbi:hypothetical protein ACHQM5_017178 [Ranunculus cassubicifolius]